MAIWKIWEVVGDIKFYGSPSFNEIDDNKLIEQKKEEVYQIQNGETIYLFVSNPTKETGTFRIQYGNA